MNTHRDPADGGDDADGIPAPPAQRGEHEDVSVGEDGRTRLPDDYKRRHEGRQAMDRWLLHKTFMEDLEAELPTRDTLNPPPRSPAPNDRSGQPSS